MKNQATAQAHTPGPWIVSESENPAVYGGERHLVVLSHPERSTAAIICDVETIPSEAEQLANARLMAAAPALGGAIASMVAGIEEMLQDEDLGITSDCGDLLLQIARIGRVAIAEATTTDRHA